MPLQAKRESERYSDFYVNIDAHPNTGELLKLINADAVKRSIRNIIFTDRYERFFQPTIGAGLKAYLFENNNPRVLKLIEDEISSTIQRYEPRANILDVSAKFEETDQSIVIRVVFSILNNGEPINLNIILNRVR